jgi:hypothetical protein
MNLQFVVLVALEPFGSPIDTGVPCKGFHSLETDAWGELL